MGDGALALRAEESGDEADAPFETVRAGRVVQIRVRRLTDLTDVERLDEAVGAALRDAAPGASICADYRNTLPLSPAIAKAWARVMREANGALARSAVLIDPRNTLFNLQMERIVRCTASEPRTAYFPRRRQSGRLDGGSLGRIRAGRRRSLSLRVLCSAMI